MELQKNMKKYDLQLVSFEQPLFLTFKLITYGVVHYHNNAILDQLKIIG
jgi:hypothetical protein